MRLTTIPARAVVLLACVLLAQPASTIAATNLPPQLIAKLEADRDRAEATLAQARRLLGAAATRQREAAALDAKLAARRELVLDVLKLVDAAVPKTWREHEVAVSTRISTQLDRADLDLELSTQAASKAQAVALDSDRRLRALQRASETQDDRDTTLGSWRFGSGGPSVSAASLDRYLQSKGSPLAGNGAAFLESGVEHEVDPRLVVAIAGAESYFGIQTCAPFNAWGWGCPTSPFSFRDWAHAIDTVTLGLREGYLDDGLVSVGEIHLRYAPPNAKNDPTDLNYAWADNVARFLVEQGGDPETVEGVLGPSR